jgi:hypothetical protein
MGTFASWKCRNFRGNEAGANCELGAWLAVTTTFGSTRSIQGKNHSVDSGKQPLHVDRNVQRRAV